VGRCVQCGDKTALFVLGIPYCTKCDVERDKERDAYVNERWEAELNRIHPASEQRDPERSQKAVG